MIEPVEFSQAALNGGIETATELRELGQSCINLAQHIEHHCAHPDDEKALTDMSSYMLSINWQKAVETCMFHVKVAQDLRQVTQMSELLADLLRKAGIDPSALGL